MDGIKEFNYIYNYIKNIYHSIEEINDERYLISLCRKIINSMRNASFEDGKLDFYINNFVNQELRSTCSETFKVFDEVKNYIYLYMNYYRMYNNVTIENYNSVLYNITRIVCNRYNYQDVISGLCDSDIEYMLECET